MSSTVHRAAFADLSGAVTLMELRSLPSAEDFGLGKGTEVKLVDLTERPDINNTLGTIHSCSPHDLARARLGVRLHGGELLSVALKNLRLHVVVADSTS